MAAFGRGVMFSFIREPHRCGAITGETMTDILNEAEAAALLNALGVPVAARTLANRRWAGNGPLFVKVASRVRYRRADLEAWAREQIGEPRRSTSARQPATAGG